MKKNFFLSLLALATFFATEAQTQSNENMVNLNNMSKTDTISHTCLTVQNEVFLIDTLRIDKPHKEAMMLEIDAQGSLFYSYTQYTADSVQLTDVVNKVSMETTTVSSSIKYVELQNETTLEIVIKL